MLCVKTGLKKLTVILNENGNTKDVKGAKDRAALLLKHGLEKHPNLSVPEIEVLLSTPPDI
jgi:hypothetical protein